MIIDPVTLSQHYFLTILSDRLSFPVIDFYDWTLKVGGCLPRCRGSARTSSDLSDFAETSTEIRPTISSAMTTTTNLKSNPESLSNKSTNSLKNGGKLSNYFETDCNVVFFIHL